MQSLDVAAQMHKRVCDDRRERLRLWDSSRAPHTSGSETGVGPVVDALSQYLHELRVTPPWHVVCMASYTADFINRALRLRRGVVADHNGRYRVGTTVANMLA